MNKSLAIRIFLIVLTALSLTYMVSVYLKHNKNTVIVYMVTQEISEREIITQDKISAVEVGFDEAMTFFSNYETDQNQILGKISNKVLDAEYVFRKNDKHLTASVEDKSTKGGKINDPYFIDENHRLMKLNLSEANSVGDKLKKGDFVDVVYTSKGAETGGLYSAVILQHVLVYDIKGDADTRHLYLKMASDECVKLTLAKNTGDITLLLNPLQGESTKPNTVTPDVFK